MSSLILHIGMPKTGTSSIQHFLFDNRALLAERGIGFPLFTPQPINVMEANGCFLNLRCFELIQGSEDLPKPRDCEENLETLRTSLSQYDRVLLSEECIFFAACPIPGGGGERTRIPYWRTMSSLLSSMGVSEIRIVLYLRRPDIYTSSWWKQEVKMGRRLPPIRTLMKQRATAFDRLLELLDCIEKYLGGFKLSFGVRRYGEGAFSGGSIFHDFCEAAGIAWDERFTLPQPWNESITFDTAEAIRQLPEIASRSTKLRQEVLIPLLYRLSKEHPEPKNLRAIEPELSRELLAPHEAEFKEISDRYLDGKRLFHDDEGYEPVWQPNRKLIASYRREILSTMLREDPASSLYGLAKGYAKSMRTLLAEGLRRR